MTLIKGLIKTLIAGILYYSGFLMVYSAIRRKLFPHENLTILLYHRVLDDADEGKAYNQPGMCVTKSAFEKQMVYLSRKYNVLSIRQLADIVESGRPLPRKSVAVTFDDGWQDNYRNAFPAMKKYNIPATIFLATDMVETNKLPAFMEAALLLAEIELWPHRAPRIFRHVVDKNRGSDKVSRLSGEQYARIGNDVAQFMLGLMKLDGALVAEIAGLMKKEAGIDINQWNNTRWMLNWDEIREMECSGIHFGSHGVSHEILIHLDHDRVRQELSESKKLIEQKSGRAVEFFGYPNNDWNAEIKKLVAQAGYRGACAGHGCGEASREIDLYALQRANVNEGAFVGASGKFSRALFAMKMSEWMRWW